MDKLNSIDDIKKLKYFDGRIIPDIKSCVYFIVHNNSVVYIGQTKKPNTRLRDYKNMIWFSLFVNERILIYCKPCPSQKLKEEEKYYIDKFKPSFNFQTKNLFNKELVNNYNKSPKSSKANIYTNATQCLADKRDASIHFRLPNWMKQQIKESGKSEADFIIGKLGLSMFKPYEASINDLEGI